MTMYLLMTSVFLSHQFCIGFLLSNINPVCGQWLKMVAFIFMAVYTLVIWDNDIPKIFLSIIFLSSHFLDVL